MQLGRWKKAELIYFMVDMLMLSLILVNLAWILFDGLYASHLVRDTLLQIWPAFIEVYDPIHQNFSAFDLVFVAIFVTELLIRWAIAIWQGTYHKWWFYPFIHWYDTLGCIPVGSFRFLRVFRIVSILFRLQRNRVIDLTRTYVFRQGRKYYNIMVEEVSDRVVLNVLGGVRDEVHQGSPLADTILRDVVAPRKSDLAEWLSDRIQAVVTAHYGHYRPELRSYVDASIEKAVKDNPEVAALEAIPLIGSTIRQTLERSIADIVFRVLDGLVRDLASEGNKVVIEESAGVFLDTLLFEEEDTRLELAVRNMVIESLDRISEQVRVQQWKEQESREGEIRDRAKRIAAIRKARLLAVKRNA